MIDDINNLIKIMIKLLCNIKDLFLLRRYKQIKTPAHVEIDVAIGMIINPILLNKLTLIKIFKKTIIPEM